MSETLDLYLEKLIAKMNLDEEQRVEVEKEIRSHLEEAIQKRVEAGFTPEEAETEALLSFGQPSVLARQFGVLSGQGWFIIERTIIACSIATMVTLFYALVPFKSDPDVDVPLYFPIGFYCLLLCTPVLLSIWKYIEVNGAIRVHRAFRRPIEIPFDSIESVRFQKGHLLGRKRICIRFSDQEQILKPKIRNFRCAALALQAICPATMDNSVKEYLARVGSAKIKKETWAKKTVLTICWLLILGLTVAIMRPMWEVVGTKFWMPVLFCPSLILIWIQGSFHSARYKRASLWILAPLFFAIPITLFIGIFLAHVTYIRWMIVGFLVLSPAPILILWWRGPKGFLLGVTILLATLACLSINRVPYIWDGRFQTLLKTSHPIESVQQMYGKDTKIAVVTSTKFDARSGFPDPPSGTLHLLASTGEVRRYELDPADQWTFIESKEPDSVSLAKWPHVQRGQQVFVERVETFTTSASRSIILPHGKKLAVGGRFPLSTASKRQVWSPERNRLLAYEITPLEKSKAKYRVASLDIETRDLTIFDLDADTYPQWTDEQVLKVAKFDFPEAATSQEPVCIHFWSLDVESGVSEISNSVVLPLGVFPYSYWDPEYYEFKVRSSSSYVVLPVNQIEDFSFSGLPERPLPSAPSRPHPNLSLSPLTGRFAYFGKDRLVVADTGGRTWTLSVEPDQHYDMILLSPDGNKVAYTEFGSDWYQRLNVWYVGDMESTTIMIKSILGLGNPQFFQSMFSIDSGTQWTPDSRSLLFPYGNQLIQADYEDWRESVVSGE